MVSRTDNATLSKGSMSNEQQEPKKSFEKDDAILVGLEV
jgi:hypothetical protein